ncbi:MAG: carbon-nitrogen hydrolase family protein, partial [Proteobacteria bacterium]
MRAFLVFILLSLQVFASANTSPKIALIQYDADKNFAQYQVNVMALTQKTLDAISQNAKMIVFPEGSLYGYASTDRSRFWCADNYAVGCTDVNGAAENVPSGPSTQHWQQISKQHQVYILFNLPEAAPVEGFFNTTVIVGPDGYVGRYRKRALYQTDQYYARPGKADFVLKTQY